MSKASELGKEGEKVAAKYLDEKGYKILAKNYFYDKAEVDIVASKDGFVVFVEVKTRISPFLSDAALMVTMGKQRQIIKVADDYIKEHNIFLEPRFDIIVIILNSQYTKIDHIEDAFYPTV